MRDLDYVNQWGMVETGTSKANWKHFWKHHEGTHAVIFTYIDRTAGMSSRLEVLCNQQADGSLQRVGGPVDQRAGVIIRYSTFPISEIIPLTTEQRQVLDLPERPDWLSIYDDGSMDELRKMTLLDPLRAPGFPDDIRFPMSAPGLQTEIVWGRLERYIPDNLFECTLLNQPHQNFGIQKDERVWVRIRAGQNGLDMVFFGKAVPGAARFVSSSSMAQRPSASAPPPTASPSNSALDKLKGLFKRRPQ